MRFLIEPCILLAVVVLVSPSLQDTRSKREDGYTDCSTNDQCATSKSCILGKCGDPCESLCGENSYCTVLHHIPACACKDGHTGNPFIGCTLQAPSQCSSSPGRKVYQIVNSHKASWQEAFMFCLRNNSRLASVDSIEEYGQLKHLIRHHGTFVTDYWTSGSDAGYEGYFVWASSGKHFSAKGEMWRPGEPNNWNNTEHCISFEDTTVNEFGLNDNDCAAKEFFICEYFVS